MYIYIYIYIYISSLLFPQVPKIEHRNRKMRQEVLETQSSHPKPETEPRTRDLRLLSANYLGADELVGRPDSGRPRFEKAA